MSFRFHGENVATARAYIGTPIDEEEKEMTLNEIVDYAIHRNNKELCQFVIEQSYDLMIWQLVALLEHALLLATAYGRRDLIDMFLDAGANDYDEALNVVAQNGNRELVDYFLSIGDCDTVEASVQASSNGHDKLARYLRGDV